MKWLIFLPALISFFHLPLLGQTESTLASKYANRITAEDLKQLVYTLASAEFEGRETGEPGNEKAANFIADKFREAGIPACPGANEYFQPAIFTKVSWETLSVSVNDQQKIRNTDFLAIPHSFPTGTTDLRIEEMTFLGYGIDDPAWSDYKNVDVKGKHLMIFSSEPMKNDEKYLITGDGSPSKWTQDPTLRIKTAFQHGAASVWVVNDNIRGLIMSQRRNLISGFTLMGGQKEIFSDNLPNIVISPAMAQEITGNHTDEFIRVRKKLTSGKQVAFSFPVDVTLHALPEANSTTGYNVLAFIEGTDPDLKNEVIVVSAHYDHIGQRGDDIFYGADDNASGTSAVMSIAKALHSAKQENAGPKRSVLCILVTGEEKGLLGSEYYCQHPVFPLENTVANVNIDMIGRIDDKHTNGNYTYVIGSDRLSTTLDSIVRNNNDQFTHLELDYTYNAKDDPNQFYYRSDHYNFAKNGIPAVFFFSGVHDDYHRPTDTPDKILFDKAETIARLAFYIAWDLANRDERIMVDVFETE